MKERLLAKEWAAYAACARPGDFSPEMEETMRIVFYAGAFAIHTVFLELSEAAAKDGPSPDGHQILQGITDELAEFAEFVRRSETELTNEPLKN